MPRDEQEGFQPPRAEIACKPRIAVATTRVAPTRAGRFFPRFRACRSSATIRASRGSTHERLDDGLPAHAVDDLPPRGNALRRAGDRVAPARRVVPRLSVRLVGA